MKHLFAKIAVGIMLLGAQACSNEPVAKIKTFVLVHGAWQGPYVWQFVKKKLEAKGQKVIVVELPAHGADDTSPAAVSIDVYRDKVIAEINKVNGKVILVGHSLGGVIVSAAAEKIPSQIEKIIYIGAFVPANGQSLADLAFQDTQSQLGPSLVPSADQLLLDVKMDNLTSIFCQDATASAQQLVLDNYRAEPAIPFGDKVTLTENNFGKTDKYYIHTAADHAIGIDLQNKMVTSANISKLYSINTGHSPFLSDPDGVTVLLLQIVN